MTGKGRINPATAEHTNLRKHYVSDEAHHGASSSELRAQASATTSAHDPVPATQPLVPSEATVLDPALPLDPALFLDSPFEQSHTLDCNTARRSSSSTQREQLSLAQDTCEQDDDSEDEFVPDEAENSEDESAGLAFDDDEVDSEPVELTLEELRIANAIRGDPNATPLSFRTIKKRMEDILRHLKIFKISIQADTQDSVRNIMKYLARVKRLYPTGHLRKRWISNETVAAVGAGVWNAAAHDIGPAGSRSVQNLLSIHTMILFMDELGGRITSWLDNPTRHDGQVGRYLRWGSVNIELCSYSVSGDPEFLLNIGSSSSKRAGHAGDHHHHMNTIATRAGQPKSQDPLFALVALGISQNVFADDVARLFTDKEYGLSLLQNRRARFSFKVKKEVEDCPVFLYGRTARLQPDKDALFHHGTRTRHPSDKPACGEHHQAMSSAHFNDALRTICSHLGISPNVTSKTFRTSYAFKNVLNGNIPAWRLAHYMGHFSGNKNLQRHDYCPTNGPIDTRRTAADAEAAFSEGVRQALCNNGAVMHLPDPGDVDPEILKKADSLLQDFDRHLDQQPEGQSNVPAATSEAIIETFRMINSGVQLPFKESLAGLLSLTSAKAVPWTVLTEQPHPFDDEEVRQGSDAHLLQWLLRGATHLCPSCHESFHSDKLHDKSNPTQAFEAFNACLRKERKRICCFVCCKFMPIEDASRHVVECFQKRYDALSAVNLEFDRLCVQYTNSFQQWKQARYFVCPVASCIDADWYTKPDADLKTFLHGTSVIKHSNVCDGPELGGGKLELHVELQKCVTHLAGHFFETTLIHPEATASRSTNVADAKHFVILPRLPKTMDEQSIICSVRNCQRQWQNDSAAQFAFLCHLINDHKFPILRHGNGAVVEEVGAADEHKFDTLVPYIPTTVASMGDLEIEHPDPESDRFYAIQNYDTLRQKATRGYIRNMHSTKMSPAMKSKKRKEERERFNATLAPEELEARRKADTERAKKRYKDAKERMTEEEMEAKRVKKNEYNRELRQRKKDDPDFKAKKAARAKRWREKKKREDPEGVKKKKADCKDPKASVLPTFNFLLGQPGAIVLAFYDGPSPPADAFRQFESQSATAPRPFTNDWKTRTILDLVKSAPSDLNAGQRGAFHTVSLQKYSRPLIELIVSELKYYGSQALLHSGGLISYDAEPFLPYSQYATDAAWPHSTNALPLNLYFAWSNPAEDAFWINAIKASAAKITAQAKSEGQNLDDVYLYPNYAVAGTPSSQLYGPNLARLSQLRQKYDPNNVMALTTYFAF